MHEFRKFLGGKARRAAKFHEIEDRKTLFDDLGPLGIAAGMRKIFAHVTKIILPFGKARAKVGLA